MLKWAFILFVISMLSFVMGYGGLAGGGEGVAKVLFVASITASAILVLQHTVKTAQPA